MLRRMSLLDELKRTRKLHAICPHCSESFPLKDAQLFDARRPLEGKPLEKLREAQAALEERRAELKQRMTKGVQRSRIAAEATNIGKVLEKVAPSLPGFTFEPADCRALFEPIDYIAFNGLSRRGLVESLQFIDVKSAAARLTGRQKAIRDTIQSGRVSFTVENLEART
jgi:predicted Holliday junction resolvase-like endonuclease